jgi:hypothetical protein
MRCAVVREDLMQKYNIPDIKSFPEIPAWCGPMPRPAAHIRFKALNVSVICPPRAEPHG